MKEILTNALTIKMLISCLSMYLIDFITGIAKVIKYKNFESSKLRSGVSKFILYFAFICLGVIIDYLFLIDVGTKICCFSVMTIEITSIVENLGKEGIKVPEQITKLFKHYRDDLYDDTYEQEMGKDE